jgi:hypothetical protein
MRRISLAVIAFLFAFWQDATAEPTTRPAVDPKAEQILHQACDTVAALKQFTFESHSIYDVVLTTGQKVQFAQNEKIFVRRPNALAAIVEGDRDDLRFWYDGKKVGVFNVRANAFSVTDAPPTVDATMDLLATKFGMTLPLADVVLSDPYKALAEEMKAAAYLGTGYVFDAVCHHLAFRQDGIDWELWVDAGKQALPRKLVITHKNAPQCPQYTAFLSNWELSPTFSDATFASPAPKGAKELPFTIRSTTQPGTVAK